MQAHVWRHRRQCTWSSMRHVTQQRDPEGAWHSTSAAAACRAGWRRLIHSRHLDDAAETLRACYQLQERNAVSRCGVVVGTGWYMVVSYVTALPHLYHCSSCSVRGPSRPGPPCISALSVPSLSSLQSGPKPMAAGPCAGIKPCPALVGAGVAGERRGPADARAQPCRDSGHPGHPSRMIPAAPCA